MSDLPPDWIKHDGYACPVDAGTIYVMLRCGMMGWVTPYARAWLHDIHKTSEYMSMTHCRETDIIAYKPES